MNQYQEIAPDIIESAKHSEDAFVQVYQHYGQRVFRFLLVKTANVQLAEDLTQETFLTVLSKLSMYTNTGAKFSSWLLQIALNHTRMHFRKHNKAETIELETIAQIWPSAPSHHNEWMDFFMARAKLSEEDQDILTMKYVEDLSNRDIAEALGISENSCGVKAHRALKRLQEYI